MWEILANYLLPKALKSCPKSNKSPDLSHCKQVKLMLIKHKQTSWIQTKYTGGQSYSDTSP